MYTHNICDDCVRVYIYIYIVHVCIYSRGELSIFIKLDTSNQLFVDGARINHSLKGRHYTQHIYTHSTVQTIANYS